MKVCVRYMGDFPPLVSFFFLPLFLGFSFLTLGDCFSFMHFSTLLPSPVHSTHLSQRARDSFTISWRCEVPWPCQFFCVWQSLLAPEKVPWDWSQLFEHTYVIHMSPKISAFKFYQFYLFIIIFICMWWLFIYLLFCMLLYSHFCVMFACLMHHIAEWGWNDLKQSMLYWYSTPKEDTYNTSLLFCNCHPIPLNEFVMWFLEVKHRSSKITWNLMQHSHLPLCIKESFCGSTPAYTP